LEIRELIQQDWEQVAAIYLAGIRTDKATFEASSPSWESWNTTHFDHSRWVAYDQDGIMGWVALTPVSDRCVYGGVGEVSVYVSPDHAQKGVGLKLLKQVIVSSEAAGIWTLTAAMFPENTASARLHEKSGFRKIGYREKIGKLKGTWRDNLLYERRSKVVV
jgi:phosphinothricin acetyltransferase